MGNPTYSIEFPCKISQARMFKAIVLDSHILIPKLMPQLIKSIEIIEGDGGVGSIYQYNFVESSPSKYMKQRIDVLDEEKFEYKYTLIEGGVLCDKVEKIVAEVKFEATDDGSICKLASYYHGFDDYIFKEEEVQGWKERGVVMYKVVEKYLLENPDIYA